MITLHELTPDRIALCAAELCALDAAELSAAGISDPRVMLLEALPLCAWAQEARWNDDPIAIFGVRALDGGEVGVPWMLTTIRMERAQAAPVARAAAAAVARMQSEYDVLTNIIHADNDRAIRFVEWLGFHVEPTRCGPNGAFHSFHWSRHV